MTQFYVHYCMFHRSFKEKCPLSGAKTQVKYVNHGMFYYVDIGTYCCVYYSATETYSGGSEFKYPGSVPKSECSIMLEICPTPNPTLNLPDSVHKYKTDIKPNSLMQLCRFNLLMFRFELLCQTVITRDSNRSSSPPKYISVLTL